MNAPKLITSGPDYVEALDKILNGFTWDYFRGVADGCQVIQGVEFKLRVGLHMKRPIEAIIALGYFIRMQNYPIEKYDLPTLVDIDPANPDRSLYHLGGASWNPWGMADSETTQKHDWTILDHAARLNAITRKRK